MAIQIEGKIVLALFLEDIHRLTDHRTADIVCSCQVVFGVWSIAEFGRFPGMICVLITSAISSESGTH